MNIKFKKPYNFEGKEYNEVEFDLSELKGCDIIASENELKKVWKENVAFLEGSKKFQAIVAAKALKQPIDFVEGLPANYFSQVTLEVQGFLLEAVSTTTKLDK